MYNIGNVDLPSKYRKLSTNGQVYLYLNNENDIVLAFWISRGILSGSTQVIYTTGGEELIRSNELGQSITSITKLDDAWYYAITDY